MKKRYFSPELRAEILNLAKQEERLAAKEKYAVQDKFLDLWEQRQQAGLPLVNLSGYLSEKDLQRIHASATQLSWKTPRQIVADNDLSVHPGSYLRIIARLDIPADRQYWVEYHCPVEGRDYHALKTFLTMTYRPDCPCGGSQMIYKSKQPVSIFYPDPDEFYLSRKRLLPVGTPDFFKRIYPLLKIPVENLPLFFKMSGLDSFHIINTLSFKTAGSWCDLKLPVATGQVCSAMTDEIPPEKVCRPCFNRYNRYPVRHAAAPLIVADKPTWEELWLKIFYLAHTTGSITGACRLYQRTTACYRYMRRNHPALFARARLLASRPGTGKPILPGITEQ